jgi:spermidine/putrescine transport system permease protein
VKRWTTSPKTAKRRNNAVNKKSFGSRLVAAPYLVWAAIFVIVPLLMMAYFAFTNESGAFTLANISEIGRYKKAFGVSILYAIIATAITLVISYPMAYFMTKMKVSSQRMIMIIVMLPMWMNFLIRTYSWISILANTGLINTFLQSVGLPKLKLINTPGAVILGMVYDFIPYMILPIYSVMSKIDNSLLEAAQDLGSNGPSRLRRVIIPLSMPGVISGITMVFVPSVSTFYISQKLGGNKNWLIGDAIEYLFGMGPDYYNVASALSLVLMVMILLCLAVMSRFTDDDEGGVIV